MKADKQVKWTGKSYGGYWGSMCFVWLLKIGLLPAYCLLFFVVLFFLLFRRKACAYGADYLTRLFGRRIRGVSWESFKLNFSFGLSIIDKVAYFGGSKNIKFIDESTSEIKKYCEKENGLLILSAHVGGWAISSGELARNFPNAVLIGAKREDERISKIEKNVFKRERPVEIAETGDAFSPIAMYNVLRDGGIVAMHADRDSGGRNEIATFLDAKVKAPALAYILASRTGASVLQVFCVREKLFTYRSFVKKIDVGGDKDSVSLAAKTFFANLEDIVRKYPYQWYNFYQFWED